MKQKTKLKLAVIHQHCNVNDKSTEYMLQLMQDTCNVNLDTCIKYMSLSGVEHKQLFTQINTVCDTIVILEKGFMDKHSEYKLISVQHRTGGK